MSTYNPFSLKPQYGNHHIAQLVGNMYDRFDIQIIDNIITSNISENALEIKIMW